MAAVAINGLYPDALYLGTEEVLKIYLGTTIIWQPEP